MFERSIRFNKKTEVRYGSKLYCRSFWRNLQQKVKIENYLHKKLLKNTKEILFEFPQLQYQLQYDRLYILSKWCKSFVSQMKN